MQGNSVRSTWPAHLPRQGTGHAPGTCTCEPGGGGSHLSWRASRHQHTTCEEGQCQLAAGELDVPPCKLASNCTAAPPHPSHVLTWTRSGRSFQQMTSTMNSQYRQDDRYLRYSQQWGTQPVHTQHTLRYIFRPLPKRQQAQWDGNGATRSPSRSAIPCHGCDTLTIRALT